MVATGSGIVVVPMSVARLHHRKDVVHRPVTGVAPSGVGLAWRVDDDDPRIEDFIGIVRGRTERSTRGGSAQRGGGDDATGERDASGRHTTSGGERRQERGARPPPAGSRAASARRHHPWPAAAARSPLTASAARRRCPDRRDDRGEVGRADTCERVEVHRAVDRGHRHDVRDRDRRHPGGGRGAHAGRGVLDGDAVGGVGPDEAGRREVGLRVRLAVADLVAR